MNEYCRSSKIKLKLKLMTHEQNKYPHAPYMTFMSLNFRLFVSLMSEIVLSFHLRLSLNTYGSVMLNIHSLERAERPEKKLN